jgi:hypothetical protein
MLSKRSPVSGKVALLTMVMVMTLVLTIFPTQVLAFDPDAPSNPILVGATPGNGTMELSWTIPAYSNASEVSEYRVYRGDTNITLELIVTLGNVTGYVDVGLVNGKTYFYSVSAVNTAGEGPRSDLLNATSPGGQPGSGEHVHERHLVGSRFRWGLSYHWIRHL